MLEKRRASVAAALAVVLVVIGSAIAWAGTTQVTSQPNGDVTTGVSVGCAGSDRDRDGNLNTCVGGDEMSLFHMVANTSDVTQTIRIDWELDGPGTELDRSTTREIVLGPNEFVDEREVMRVQNRKTPLGEYTLTVTGAGTETATASTSVIVGTKNVR